MKIIDVVENPGTAGLLKKYYEDNNINDYNITFLWLCLSKGYLHNRIDFLKEYYEFWDYDNLVDNFINNLSLDTKIRIWSSTSNNDDYLLILYLCNLLKDKYDLSIIMTNKNINEINSKDIGKLLKEEKILAIQEINDYSNKWNELVRVNSELRIYKDGIIENKNYDDYDALILERLKKLGKCKISTLVESLWVEDDNNFTLDDYEYLVNRLINNNKINLVEDKNGIDSIIV
ncbi:MAG: DUF1835 domain-containing protein [Bacilli bacterium]|nr:DUF1835 domain-containing protein [Bacilli bacterium]